MNLNFIQIKKFRWIQFFVFLIVAWFVMTITHEGGHLVGGWISGGVLQSANLWPWRLPYSFFEPDPFPLITLWSGLILGVLIPLTTAWLIQKEWAWFIAYFCLLANGLYIAAAWVSGDRYLDTARLLEQGANPISIAIYCFLTIGFGYAGFRKSCLRVLLLSKEQPTAG